MSINAIGTGYQNQTYLPKTLADKETQNIGDPSEVNKLNAEIKQAESDIKETMKEVQKAVAESIDGASQMAQLLQSKILMQQQEIMTKQLQIKEIELPEDAATKQASTAIDVRPRFDRYEKEQADAKTPDNVYRLEQKDGKRQVIFNREQME